MDPGQHRQAVPPQPLLVGRVGVGRPAAHGVGRVVTWHLAVDLAHGEKGGPQYGWIVLVPEEGGQRDVGAGGQCLHHPPLGLELRLEEDGVAGGLDPDHESLVARPAVLRPGGVEEQRVAGHPIRRRALEAGDNGVPAMRA